MVAGRALIEAKSDAKSDELIKAVVADFESSEGRAAARDGLQGRIPRLWRCSGQRGREGDARRDLRSARPEGLNDTVGASRSRCRGHGPTEPAAPATMRRAGLGA